MIEAGVSRLRAIGTKAGITVLAPAAKDPVEIAYTLLDVVDLLLSPPGAEGKRTVPREESRRRVIELLDEILGDEEGRKGRLYG